MQDNAGMSATVHFTVKYDSPALHDHQMDVRELAPALIALSDLLDAANKSVFPDAAEVRVNVRGNFKGGSFGVDLIAVQSIGQQIVDLLAGKEATATANLLSLLTGLGLLGSGGLIGLIKFLAGRKPNKIHTSGDKVVFEIVEDETIESYEVDLITVKLYQTRIVRQSLARVVKPLERDGIDVFSTGKDGVTQNVVTDEELYCFLISASEADVVSDTVSAGVLLQIESAVFREGNKWRFSDGANTFFAEITDSAFVSGVNEGLERFGKGDLLVVDLRRTQFMTDGGLKTEFVIEKVVARKPPQQHKLLT